MLSGVEMILLMTIHLNFISSHGIRVLMQKVSVSGKGRRQYGRDLQMYDALAWSPEQLSWGAVCKRMILHLSQPTESDHFIIYAGKTTSLALDLH